MVVRAELLSAHRVAGTNAAPASAKTTPRASQPGAPNRIAVLVTTSGASSTPAVKPLLKTPW
jgi:hypothetical protein